MPDTWIPAPGGKRGMSSLFQVRPGALTPHAKPVRDPGYLRFIRSFACLVCRPLRYFVDACHTGPHGVSQKACDLTCIPLCRKHHQEYDRNPRQFEKAHRLNVATRVAGFNAEYRRRERKKAA